MVVPCPSTAEDLETISSHVLDSHVFFERHLLGLLDGNNLLLAHGAHDGDHQVLAVVELIDDFLAQLLTTAGGIGWQVQVVLGVTTLGQHGNGASVVIDIQQLKLNTGDVWDLHVVGRWAHIFVLLVGEDIDSGDTGLGVTVLSGLGDGNIGDLARESLQQTMSTFPQGTSLHREGVGATGIGAFELMVVRHCDG